MAECFSFLKKKKNFNDKYDLDLMIILFYRWLIYNYSYERLVIM